jgi:glycosyltransferase involved in cell wall biosynthesis
MISIVIPTLNEETTISDTLERLKYILGVDYEIIVSDGRSSDNTVKLAKKYTDKVVVYDGQIRQTIANARNLGASLAKGEFLLFLDADVRLVEPQKFLITLLERFQGDPRLVAATTRIKILPENATLADRILSILMIDWPHFLNNNLWKTGSSSGEIQFIRKSAFDQVGGFDDLLVSCEDINMFERLAKIGQTRMFYDLVVYHSGRRFHKLGWPKVLWTWTVNIIYYKLFGRTKSKEWTVVR